ncbi:acetyl-CoA C-acetyltransferase [Enterococcus thailandicus]|uniref:acetyl-CoA C-acetyltransferase n=1 Tax=Enterococcus thailandicus TaxID=417368 RepID=UPI0022E49AFD|nr:acetyl-CoA C-acetyltransferase [Enterococcus thailandicus]
MSRKVVITNAVRTPIGAMGGALSNFSVSDLGAIVIKRIIEETKISTNLIDEVNIGTVFQAGQGQNVARQASMKAGIPFTVPATTINILCGSGLHSVNLSAKMIQSGNADVIIAGGMENMSAAPYLLDKARFGYRLGNSNLIDSMINDGLEDAFSSQHMGITAENVAERWHLSREELDIFAEQSQRKAANAIVSGRFKDEIVPVEVQRKKETFIFEHDESLRSNTSYESLAKLRPVFKKDGIVTAGNSSGIGDGAAAVMLMTEEKALELELDILGYWESGELAGVEPDFMGIGPVDATRKALSKTSYSIEDIDLIELNEAFAAQSLAVIEELKLDSNIVNVNGGAIALGHPLGASGCRILVSLIHEMKKRKSKIGLASLCIGGGMGSSTIIRNK